MPQATSFDTILTQCRDLVCERLDAAVAGMLDKADDALLAMVSETREQETQKLYLETRDRVLLQRQTIEAQFHSRYLLEFQQRSNRVKKIGVSFSDIDLSSLELELVGEDDLNETLKFNAMAAKLRGYCDEELIALDQRVGVLIGDASLQPEDNPFNPQAIVDAYRHTCRQVDPDVNVRLVLLKLFDDHVADDLRAVYKAVNSLLVQNSILPRVRVGSPQKQAAPPDSRAGATAAQAAVAGGEQDLFSVLQRLLVAGPAAPAAVAGQPGTLVHAGGAATGHAPGEGVTAAGAVPGAAALQSADLLRSLTRLQLGDASHVTAAGLPLAADLAQPGTINVLRELKGTSLASGMNQMDTMTLDIMAMLFDQLFDDPKIPIGVKGLIGRLQIPMLKVAIADKAFFSKKTHPARQMLDTLGEMSTRLPADFDVSSSVYGRLDAILHELIDGYEDDIEIFNVVRERLQTLVAEEDQRIEQQTQSSAKEVERKENLAVAKTVARAEIKVRIRGAKIPLPVLKFLVQEWIKYLIVVNVKFGESSEEWKTALKTVELLVWSVEPKETPAERRKLLAMLPDLLKRLAVGTQLGGVEEAVRSNFFTGLRKLHTEIIGRTAVANGAPVAKSAEELQGAAHAPTAPPAPVEAAQPEPLLAQLPPMPAEPAAPVPASPVPVPEFVETPPAISFLPDLPPVLEQSTPSTPDLPPAAKEPVAPIPTLPDLPPLPKEVARPVPPPPPTPAAPKRPAPQTARVSPPVSRAPVPPTRPASALPARPLAPRQTAHAPAGAPPPRQAPQPAQTSAARPPVPAGSKAAASGAGTVDFTAPVTVNNPFGDGKVQVDDLDFTVKPAAAAARAKADASDAELPAELKVGSWVEIREKDSRRPARLTFISPLKTRYLFINRQGKTVLECSRAELVRRFRLGEMAVTQGVAEPPLFDRLMDDLVNKLGGPAK